MSDLKKPAELTKLGSLLRKEEKEAEAYAIDRHFTPDYLEDFEDEFEDEESEEEEEEEKEEEEEEDIFEDEGEN